MKSYCTFGQSHVHPITKEKMKDYWVEVYTPYDSFPLTYSVYVLMTGKYSNKWGDIYTRDNFNKEQFPKGCYEVLGEKSAEDELDDLLEEIYDKRKTSREAERIRDSDNQLLSQK